ncbi:MAG TPA: hypothetical protein VEC99_13445, partial [Clostridia bacterium]|nr:hypothetical protein [Clostridia bacterium]
MNQFWRAIESIPDFAAVAQVWRNCLGRDYGAFAAAFLQPRLDPVRSYPCPNECGCAHEIVPHANGAMVGVCRCEPWGCEDLILTPDEVICYELSLTRLGRALCKALDLRAQTSQFGLSHTLQIGSWSTEAVPAILTLQSELSAFRRVVAELVARLRQPFILLAPTADLLDATAKELMAGVGAGFLSLEAHFTLTERGHLVPSKAPGELLARFQPEPDEPVQDDT